MRRRLDVRGVELIELLDELEDRVQLADEQGLFLIRNCKLGQLADILNFFNADFHGIHLPGVLTEAPLHLVISRNPWK